MSSAHPRSSEPGAAMGAASRARPAPGLVAVPPPPRPVLGPPWSLAAVAPTGIEVALVHAWMRAPHVERWWHQAWPLSEWSDEVARQAAGTHSRPWVVAADDHYVGYLEAYRVARDVIAENHPTGPHDLGVHLAIGDVARTGQGLGPRLLRAVAEGLLAADPACQRVVGDPATGHAAARRAFAAAGFEALAEVDLGHKRAALMAYDRAGHRHGPEAGRATARPGAAGPPDRLPPAGRSLDGEGAP